MVLAITSPPKSPTATPIQGRSRSHLGLPVRGAELDWSKLPGGRIVVYDAPIMGVVHKGDHGGVPLEMDQAWHRKAKALSDERARNGYLSPLHHYHFDGEGRPGCVGLFHITDIRNVSLFGEVQSCLIADLYCTRQYAERVLNGELPYCSVEIEEDWSGVKSLALLDSEPPHFKFPIITLKATPVPLRELKQFRALTSGRNLEAQADRARRFASSGDGHHIYAKGNPMPKPKKAQMADTAVEAKIEEEDKDDAKAEEEAAEGKLAEDGNDDVSIESIVEEDEEVDPATQMEDEIIGEEVVDDLGVEAEGVSDEEMDAMFRDAVIEGVSAKVIAWMEETVLPLLQPAPIPNPAPPAPIDAPNPGIYKQQKTGAAAVAAKVATAPSRLSDVTGNQSKTALPAELRRYAALGHSALQDRKARYAQWKKLVDNGSSQTFDAFLKAQGVA